MNHERIRSILGVWAPMGIGLFIIVTSINFYFTAALADTLLVGNLESWRLVCSAGAFFVGGLLILSTYGRFAKTREARRSIPAATSIPPPATPPDQEPDDQRDRENDDR